MFVAEGLLAVHQHNVAAAPGQLPILKTVVQQKRVAAEFLDRISPGSHAVLVHQHDHVFQVRREHVRFVAGRFRIQQQRFAIGDDARWRAIFAEQHFIDEPFHERRRL